MQKVSLSLEEEHIDRMDALVEDGAADSRSEAARLLLDEAARVEQLETDVEHAEARIQELENQLAHVRDREEDVQELVEYVETEMTLQEQREQRRRASVVERAKWWVFGVPDDLEDE